MLFNSPSGDSDWGTKEDLVVNHVVYQLILMTEFFQILHLTLPFTLFWKL